MFQVNFNFVRFIILVFYHWVVAFFCCFTHIRKKEKFCNSIFISGRGILFYLRFEWLSCSQCASFFCFFLQLWCLSCVFGSTRCLVALTNNEILIKLLWGLVESPVSNIENIGIKCKTSICNTWHSMIINH